MAADGRLSPAEAAHRSMNLKQEVVRRLRHRQQKIEKYNKIKHLSSPRQRTGGTLRGRGVEGAEGEEREGLERADPSPVCRGRRMGFRNRGNTVIRHGLPLNTLFLPFPEPAVTLLRRHRGPRCHHSASEWKESRTAVA